MDQNTIPLIVKLLFEPTSKRSIFLKFMSYILFPIITILYTYFQYYDMLNFRIIEQFSINTLLNNKNDFLIYFVFLIMFMTLIAPLVSLFRKITLSVDQWVQLVNTGIIIDMGALTVITLGSLFINDILGAMYASVCLIRTYTASALLENVGFRNMITSKSHIRDYILPTQNIHFGEVIMIIFINLIVILALKDLYFVRFLIAYQIGALSLYIAKKI